MPVPPVRRFGRGGWILLAVLGLVVAGGVAVLVPAALDLGQRVDDLARVDTPGRSTVTLSAGDQVIYVEYPGANCTGTRRDADGDVDGCEPVPMPAFDLRVTDSGEQTVPIDRYNSSLTYDLSGRSGRAIGTIDVPADGEYTIATTGGPVTIAIGPSIAQGIVRVVLAAVLAGLAFIGLIVTGIVMVVRRRAR